MNTNGQAGARTPADLPPVDAGGRLPVAMIGAGRVQPFRLRILCLALEALAAQGDVVSDRVFVHIRADGIDLRYTAEGAELRALAGDPRLAGLSPMELALLESMDAEPRPVKELCRLAGYAFGSHVYGALRKLSGLGLCRKHAGARGYSLPGD